MRYLWEILTLLECSRLVKPSNEGPLRKLLIFVKKEQLMLVHT